MIKILILEDDDGAVKRLEQMLQETGFQHHATRVNAITELETVFEMQQVDLAIANFSFLQKKEEVDLVAKFDALAIPNIWLFSNENIEGFESTPKEVPYAVIGEQFNVHSLKKIIEVALFAEKKEEYLSLRRQLVLEHHIFIKTGSQLEKLYTGKILYIAADGNYSMIQTEERKYAVKLSLKKILEELPTNFFIRIHKGYIVQMAKISKIDIAENQVFIGEQALPLGRYYKSDVLARLKKLG